MRDAWVVVRLHEKLGFHVSIKQKRATHTGVVMAGGSVGYQEPVNWSGAQWRYWLIQAHGEAEVESKISSNETHPQESQSRQIIHPLPAVFIILQLSLEVTPAGQAKQMGPPAPARVSLPTLEVIRVNLINL